MRTLMNERINERINERFLKQNVFYDTRDIKIILLRNTDFNKINKTTR